MARQRNGYRKTIRSTHLRKKDQRAILFDISNYYSKPEHEEYVKVNAAETLGFEPAKYITWKKKIGEFYRKRQQW